MLLLLNTIFLVKTWLPEGHAGFPWPACPEEGEALSRGSAREKILSAHICVGLAVNLNCPVNSVVYFPAEFLFAAPVSLWTYPYAQDPTLCKQKEG